MITIRIVEALKPGQTAWDDGRGSCTGFGVRRRADAISYVLKYRNADGRQRWATIGRHGAPWTPDTARAKAREMLGEVAKGADPQAEKSAERAAETVAELCELYLDAMEAGRLLTRRGEPKRASTMRTDASRINRHIAPVLGRLKVSAVTRADIERLRDAIAEGETAMVEKMGPRALARVTGGKGQSTRTLGLLGAIFEFAIQRGIRPDNPCRSVPKHRYQERKRRMSEAEYQRLGAALRDLEESFWPFAAAAVKFLCVSGWRLGEVTGLKWDEVDLATRTARLRATKTGESMRPLSKAASDLLEGLPRMGSYVFPSSRGGEQAGLRSWRTIARTAALPSDVSPHVLRHSFASVAGDLGYSDNTIAALVGHARHSVTSRYVHTADAVLLQAADAVADRISAAMGNDVVSLGTQELREA